MLAEARAAADGRRRVRRGPVPVAGRRRRRHGLLPGQRGQRAADGPVRSARPDGGGTGPRAAPRRIGPRRRTWRSAGCAWCRMAGRAGPGGEPGSGAGGGSATFRAPSTVWVQSGLPLRPEFTARLHEAAATLADADFAGAQEAARTLINRAIAEQTEGKITGLLPPGAVSRTDQAGARQCGVPEGGLDAAVPRERDGRRSVLPGRPGPSEPDRADDAPHRAAGLPARRRVPGRAAPLP